LKREKGGASCGKRPGNNRGKPAKKRFCSKWLYGIKKKKRGRKRNKKDTCKKFLRWVQVQRGSNAAPPSKNASGLGNEVRTRQKNAKFPTKKVVEIQRGQVRRKARAAESKEVPLPKSGGGAGRFEMTPCTLRLLGWEKGLRPVLSKKKHLKKTPEGRLCRNGGGAGPLFQPVRSANSKDISTLGRCFNRKLWMP